MLAQIEQNVVAFLVGSALSFFATLWIKKLWKIDAVEYGVQSILRDRMTQMRRFYTDKNKPIPQQEVDSFLQMYEAYKRLGGNGYVDEIKHQIVEVMPHENH